MTYDEKVRVFRKDFGIQSENHLLYKDYRHIKEPGTVQLYCVPKPSDTESRLTIKNYSTRSAVMLVFTTM